MTNKQGKIVRVVAIILLALTAIMNLVGGIGTTCAAFFTAKYPPMEALLGYQWLYQFIVIATVVLGLSGAWATFRLFRGGAHVYRNALIVLGIGALVGGVHMFASLALRGKAVPANVKFYINLVTFLVFLVLGSPGIRKAIGFDRAGDKTDMTAAGGMAAIVAATVLLTMTSWAGPSHIFDGTNWIDVLWQPMQFAGVFLLVSGIGALVKALSTLFATSESHLLQGELGR